MWNSLKNIVTKIFSPAPRVPVQRTEPIEDPVVRSELGDSLLMLYNRFQTHPTTALDEELYAQILLLMKSIKQYPSPKLAIWQSLEKSYFDPNYIAELKDTPRRISYGQPRPYDMLSILVIEEPRLPFPTTEYVLEEIGRSLETNKIHSYRKVLPLCDCYQTRTRQLMSLSPAEKQQLIAALKTEWYALKFEMALDHYVEHYLKDEDSFRYFVERILTFTAVDFMFAANKNVMPSRISLSEPINIPTYSSSPIYFSPLSPASLDDDDDDDDEDETFDFAAITGLPKFNH